MRMNNKKILTFIYDQNSTVSVFPESEFVTFNYKSTFINEKVLILCLDGFSF
jgi:hypothetical protein